jgi:hypothetical protein
MALGALLVLSAALSLPGGATCSYDAATATVQVQMHSARTVVGTAGDGRILVDGHVCATVAQTRQIVVASAFPPAADTVVVDERHGRLADPATGRRPRLYALTGSGGDTMEVLGTPGRDHYVAHDDLGASIDLDADGTPDFVSTDVGRVVLRGMAGDDVLAAGAGPDDRMSHRAELFGGPGNDVLRAGRSGHDRLVGGPGLDTVHTGPGDAVSG